jgi:RNA polymerase sigma-70 factor (ECF subfamily)
LLTRCAENDIQTIAGLKRQDPGAMVDLYDRYGRIVYSVVYRIVRNSGEAEEIVQEIFLRVWTCAHLVEDSCRTLGPWLPGC